MGLGDSLGQVQPETGALELLARAGIELVELGEQAVDLPGRNADPGVLDVYAKEIRVLGRDVDGDAAALAGELARVRQVVVEDLLHPRRIGRDDLDLRLDTHAHLQALVGDEPAHDVAHLARERAEIDGLGRCLALVRMSPRYSTCLGASAPALPLCIRSVNPMIALSGVRSSCDMLARSSRSPPRRRPAGGNSRTTCGASFAPPPPPSACRCLRGPQDRIVGP